MKTIFILSLIFAAMCRHGTFIPPPDKITVDTAKCILTNKHDFTIIRVYTADGKIDPNALNNLAAAHEAGFKDIEVSISPCLTSEPEDQVKEVIELLKKDHLHGIWINVDVRGWREFKSFNQMFLEDLVNGFTKAGIKVGIISSKLQWEDFFTASYSAQSKLPLAYVSLNKEANFNDFKAFGGWKKPFAKHYQSGADLCSLKMELLYKE